jgi:hypothetical protein
MWDKLRHKATWQPRGTCLIRRCVVHHARKYGQKERPEMKRISQIGLLALAASTLAACDGGQNTGTAAAAPLTAEAPAREENSFGANFGTAFRAAQTATLVTPADGDVVPLSLMTNPTAIG